MDMMLLRIKSFFQVIKFSHYPISFILTSPSFKNFTVLTQEDNDQAFPVSL